MPMSCFDTCRALDPTSEGPIVSDSRIYTETTLIDKSN